MISEHSKLRAVSDTLIIVLFLVTISLPELINFLRPSQALVAAENRPLVPKPELKWNPETLDTFPARYEAYYNDHFGLRHTLIHWLNVSQSLWLKTSTSPKVIIGKHGWLFYTIEPVGNDYPSQKPFSPEELARWLRMLECRRDWLAARGILYIFVIAPDKQSIYPEHLTRTVRRRYGQGTRLDQLVGYFNSHSDFRILDLRDSLREAKVRELLFSLTDSHWNHRGAFVAYQTLMEKIAQQFPAVKPLPRSMFESAVKPSQGGDLARMLGLEKRLPEEILELVPRLQRQAKKVDAGYSVPLSPQMQPFAMERSDSTLPRAVIFRDSFADALIPFLSEHFQRVFYLWQEPYEFDFSAIERERPDIVIQEIVERKLGFGFPLHSSAGI
jgi:alginate O-acetyltransferase complex protein AlgJ